MREAGRKEGKRRGSIGEMEEGREEKSGREKGEHRKNGGRKE